MAKDPALWLVWRQISRLQNSRSAHNDGNCAVSAYPSNLNFHHLAPKRDPELPSRVPTGEHGRSDRSNQSRSAPAARLELVDGRDPGATEDPEPMTVVRERDVLQERPEPEVHDDETE